MLGQQIGNLPEIDREFINGRNNNNNRINEDLNDNPTNIYNPAQFQTEILTNFFQIKIFKKNCYMSKIRVKL